MSGLFEEGVHEAPARPNGRSRALVVTAIVLVLLFLGLSTFAQVYTDRLWYHSGGYAEVFSTLLWTKTGLFLVFGAVMGLVVGVNIYLAYRFRPFFRPSSPEQSGLDRYREVVTPIRTWLLLGSSAVIAMFAGSSAIGEWRDFLMWRNGESFGRTDRWFKKDLGFYVFELPWLHYVVDFAMVVLVISIIAAAVVHYLYGGIRLQATRDRLSGAAQAQLSVLLGLFVLVKAADYWLDRFDLVSHSGGVVTGMTYTSHNAVLPAKNILLGIAVICAVLFFVNVWRRTWLLPSVGLALLAVSAILLGLIWPGIVQQFQVKPSEGDKEAPYIAANIKATRAAYDIEDVAVTQFNPPDQLGGNVDQLDGKTSSVPLVDPLLVRDAFEQNQQGRAYYSVASVLDVDRYPIDGIDRALVLGVRELDQSGVPTGDRNWSNMHTVYTHGNGIIAAYANQRPENNQAQIDTSLTNDQSGIVWAQGRDPGQDGLVRSLPDGYVDGIYYGEKSPAYSVVGKAKASAPDVELDLPADGSVDTSDSEKRVTFTGPGDASIGGAFNQLMFAVKFGEPNFLLSGRVNAGSKVLFDRTPRQRVEKVAPWLTVDSDPYPAIIDGRVQWILDGYTTTDRYPNAEKDSFKEMTDDSLQAPTGLQTLPTDDINYMRNAVKATVDAYSGKVTLYEWDQSDPMLRAWESAFPGTVQPKSSISDDLMRHLRYPEDMFQVQRYQFARYHVTDPGDFFQGNNRWEVPEDPYSSGTFQPPYRLFLDDPSASDGSGRFSVTSVYVPYQKNNLASFVSVDSDATSSDYGRMRVLQLPTTGSQTQGPGQVANTFASEPHIAELIATFNRSNATPRYGNVLTLPINGGLMYVQPVYALRAGSTSSYPILRYVLVKYGDHIGYGTTLVDALRVLVGETSSGGGSTGGSTGGSGSGTGGATGGSVSAQIDRLLQQASDAYAAADKALRSGDLAAYQAQVSKAQDAVEQALALAEQRGAGGKSGGNKSGDKKPSGSGQSLSPSPLSSPSPSS